ncbi:MAG: DUF3592 domain-containing protein [Phycisphaeraceae bacterium]|nr:DUF3592 domain-containing protein [Phycisphaeraceae bacterium]
MMRKFGFFFTLIPLTMMAAGVGFAIYQHVMLVRYQPITATIERTWIDIQSDSDGTSYAPKVDHRYEVAGQSHVGNRVFPLEVHSSSRSEAQRTINRFTVGQSVTAYYLPSSPSSSFLLKEPTFFPYIFVLFPMLFFAVGVSFMIGAPRISKTEEDPKPAIEGFFELAPSTSLIARLKASGFVTGLWWLAGLFCLLHFTGIGGRMTAFPSIALGIYGGLGLIGLGVTRHYLKLYGQVHDAMVMINTAKPRIGESITVYVEQLIKRGLIIDAVYVGLRCEEHYRRKSGNETSYGTEVHYESETLFHCPQEDNFESGKMVSPGEALRYSGILTLPDGQPSSFHGPDYPRFKWFITVHTDIARGPDYKAIFPIEVLPAARAPAPRQPIAPSIEDADQPLVLEDPIR